LLRHEVGYRFLRGLLRGARLVPLNTLQRGGSALGRMSALAQPRERSRTHSHLALAFPDRDQAWRRRVLAGTASHLGTLLGEVGWLWSAAPDDILARTEMVGLEHLTSSIGERGGAVLVTGHCGNWEWLNLALGACGVPMSAAAREVYDPRLDEVIQTLRARFGGETILRGPGAGQRLARALGAGRVLGMLIDQDIDVPGAFVEFFGRPAWTPTGAAVLALRARRPLVPGFARRLPDGRARMTFEAPIWPFSTGDLEADAARLTARLTSRIEAWIREEPAQWVWMHRRWRRQPQAGDRIWSPEGDSAASSPTPG